MKSHNRFNPRPLPTQTRAAAPYPVSRFVFVFPESGLLVFGMFVFFVFFSKYLDGGLIPGRRSRRLVVGERRRGAPTGEKRASVAVTLQHPGYF